MKTKIKVRSGEFSLDYTGPEKFAKDELVALAREIAGLAKEANAAGRASHALGQETERQLNLASFLKSRDVKLQHRLFLATAAWLQMRGRSQISTGNVSEALRDYKQGRLTNPSDCLAKNISNGYCEKTGSRSFRVSEEGFNVLDLERERVSDSVESE